MLDVRVFTFTVLLQLRVMKLLSRDSAYEDAPREGIRRIMSEVHTGRWGREERERDVTITYMLPLKPPSHPPPPPSPQYHGDPNYVVDSAEVEWIRMGTTVRRAWRL